MTPPISNRTDEYDVTAPLFSGLWSTVGSFDTADQCQKVQGRMIDSYKKKNNSRG
jgi:hypothetical protein